MKLFQMVSWFLFRVSLTIASPAGSPANSTESVQAIVVVFEIVLPITLSAPHYPDDDWEFHGTFVQTIRTPGPSNRYTFTVDEGLTLRPGVSSISLVAPPLALSGDTVTTSLPPMTVTVTHAQTSYQSNVIVKKDDESETTHHGNNEYYTYATQRPRSGPLPSIPAPTLRDSTIVTTMPACALATDVGRSYYTRVAATTSPDREISRNTNFTDPPVHHTALTTDIRTCDVLNARMPTNTTEVQPVPPTTWAITTEWGRWVVGDPWSGSSPY